MSRSLVIFLIDFFSYLLSDLVDTINKIAECILWSRFLLHSTHSVDMSSSWRDLRITGNTWEASLTAAAARLMARVYVDPQVPLGLCLVQRSSRQGVGVVAVQVANVQDVAFSGVERQLSLVYPANRCIQVQLQGVAVGVAADLPIQLGVVSEYFHATVQGVRKVVHIEY